MISIFTQCILYDPMWDMVMCGEIEIKEASSSAAKSVLISVSVIYNQVIVY